HPAHLRLGQRSLDSCSPSLFLELMGHMHGQHEDGNVRNKLADLPGGLHSIHPRHQEIHDDQPWMQLLDLLQRIHSVGSFPADNPVHMFLEQVAQSLPHQRAVINDENARLQCSLRNQAIRLQKATGCPLGSSRLLPRQHPRLPNCPARLSLRPSWWVTKMPSLLSALEKNVCTF